MVILRHVHLPGLTSYAHVSRLQQELVSRLLRYKANASQSPFSSALTDAPPSLPAPTIITFTPHPIYTAGRRESKPPSPSQLAILRQPLQTRAYGLQIPEFEQALRGGQTTFHGPGQLVIYPILSLSHPYSFQRGTASRLTPRCYVHLLEQTTISTLAHYNLRGIRTENPGVWIDADNKIAALGVHLRRNVTSHGVGLNVGTDLRWFERIVACGLEGKGVTSMWAEDKGLEEEELGVEEVARVWVGEFARGVGPEGADVARIKEEDVLAQDGVERV